MEHTYDSVGQRKEIIVIEDSATPEKFPKKRTRAVAAQEAAAAREAENLRKSMMANGTSSSVGGSAKKRKVEDIGDAGTAKKVKGKVSVGWILVVSD
jgi:dual-specificity kinase